MTTSQANYSGNYPYNNNPKGEYREKTMPVGTFAANAWGLYDMHGNVSEWCSDWYGDYPTTAQTNPKGPETWTTHVQRGGNCCAWAQGCRSALRDFAVPFQRSYNVGFRIVSTK